MPDLRRTTRDKLAALIVDQMERNRESIQAWLDEPKNEQSPDSEMPERLRYVNAYELSREYGGQEEGGWYFDAGTPVACIRVHNSRDAAIAAKAIHDIWHLAVEGDREYTSVLGGTDIRVSLEHEEASEFPAERPMYC